MRSTPATVAAMLRELVRYRHFIGNLVLKDLKLKYRGSILGLVWSLLNPLLMLAVYTLAFKYVLRVHVEHYAYFLLIGLLPWNFFAASALVSTRVILDGASLIKTVYFPREALPIAAVLFNFSQLLLALAVFLPALLLLSGVRLHWSALLVLALLPLHLLFTVGLAFVLCTSTVLFRDVAHLTEVALVLLFWVTPIVYPVAMAPAQLQLFFKTSPLAAFALAYQDVLFWGRVPEGLVILTLLAWTVVVVLGGYAFFRRHSPAFAERV